MRVKSGHRVGVGGEGGPRSGADLTSAPKVTFRDNPSGEVRKVNLQVSLSCVFSGISLCFHVLKFLSNFFLLFFSLSVLLFFIISLFSFFFPTCYSSFFSSL